MAKKYYVVWKGRSTGVFDNWESCKAQVYGFPGARYKSFPSQPAADAAYAQGPGSSAAKTPSKRSTSGKAGDKKGAIKTYSADEVDAHPATLKLFTDGGCEPNPGEAGSGVAVYRDNALTELWYGLYNPMGTNNTAELNALLQALQMAKEALGRGDTVAIFCDSQYSIRCVTQWAPGWRRNGWKRKDGEIKNLAVVKALHELYETMGEQIALLHVNGHVGVEGNELADRMSLVAVRGKERDFVRYTDPMNVAAILATPSF